MAKTIFNKDFIFIKKLKKYQREKKNCQILKLREKFFTLKMLSNSLKN